MPDVEKEILKALQNGKLWKVHHGMTGRGYPIVTADEIVEVLKIDKDTVIDSLESLEQKGHVTQLPPSLDDPSSPQWHLR